MNAFQSFGKPVCESPNTIQQDIHLNFRLAGYSLTEYLTRQIIIIIIIIIIVQNFADTAKTEMLIGK